MLQTKYGGAVDSQNITINTQNQHINLPKNIPIHTPGFGFNIPVQILSPFGHSQVIISTDQKLNPALMGIEKNHDCHICHKQFPTLSSLNVHIKQHVDEKEAAYRNIVIAASSAGNHSAANLISSGSSGMGKNQHNHQINSIVDYQHNHGNEVKSHQPQATFEIKTRNLHEYTIVNTTPHIIQQQPREREKMVPNLANNLQIIKQNPVEYHIQQQQHAAAVVAAMNQSQASSSKSAINPFLNSTIKYELSSPPIQLVTEVYPNSQMIVESNDDMNSTPSSASSPISNHQASTTPTPAVSVNEGGDSMKHKCQVCDKSFTTMGNLNLHVKIHSGQKPYKCRVCLKGFIQSNNLATHMKIHTGERPHECTVCSKRFSQSNNLKTHMRTHTGERPYSCSLCSKTFNQKNNLSTHLRTHADYHPSNCSICQQHFSSFNELFYHMRDHADEKPHICSICNKVFAQLPELNEHIKQHANPKPFQCNICQKQFSQSNNLKTHIKTHIYQDPFKCTMCSRSFQEEEEYALHIRVHTVDKPYECTFCGKKFIQSNNLKTHVRTHTGEKPYECTQCSKTFNQKNNLNTHMRVHTGEKPFECTICDRRFNQSNNLNKHLKTHGQEKELTQQMENEMEKMMNTVINQT